MACQSPLSKPLVRHAFLMGHDTKGSLTIVAVADLVRCRLGLVLAMCWSWAATIHGLRLSAAPSVNVASRLPRARRTKRTHCFACSRRLSHLASRKMRCAMRQTIAWRPSWRTAAASRNAPHEPSRRSSSNARMAVAVRSVPARRACARHDHTDRAMVYRGEAALQ